nr:pentatricopeptide repeat-containing protein [Tanacetum cinerariifolium]
MENDASNMSYVELISWVEEEAISWVEEEAGSLKSPDKHVIDKCKIHVNKTMDKGKSKVLADDIPVKKHVRRINGIVIEENVNPVAMDTNSDSESEVVDEFNYTLYTDSESDYSNKSVDYLSEGEDELIDLRKRKTEAKKAPKKANRQSFPVNEGTSSSNNRQRVYRVGDSETLMKHEEFMDDLMRKLRDEGDGITDPFKIVELKVEKYPIHDVEPHWSIRKPKYRHAKRWALSEGEKTIEDHYAYIRSYGKAVLESNHGSTVKAGVTLNPDIKTYFDRFYVCFKGLKEGWKLGCRNVIVLDGFFLKKPNVGEILTAIGRDENNHIFLVACAVVNVENKDNWSWFLDLLGDDLDMPTGNYLTLISDQYKVRLIQAVVDRQCARHIYEGFRKQFSGVEFRSLFWAASKASYPGLFNKIMDKIKRANPKAYQYLLDKDPKTWSRAYFRIGGSCWSHGVNTYVQTYIRGENLFEVRNGSQAFRVDEEHRTCTCRLWQLSVGGMDFWPDYNEMSRNSTVVLPPKPPTKKGRPRKAQVSNSSLLDDDLVDAPVDSAPVDVITQNIQNVPNAVTAATQSSQAQDITPHVVVPDISPRPMSKRILNRKLAKNPSRIGSSNSNSLDLE